MIDLAVDSVEGSAVNSVGDLMINLAADQVVDSGWGSCGWTMVYSVE